MGFDGFRADSKFGSDITAGKAVSNQIENLRLSTGEPIDAPFNLVQIYIDEMPVQMVGIAGAITNQQNSAAERFG